MFMCISSLEVILKTMIFPFLVLLVIFVLVFLDQWKATKFIKLHKEIGVSSKAFPFIGHGFMFIGNGEDRISTIQNISEQAYRNKYGMVSFLIGNFSCVAISEPVAAHFVLRNCLEKGQMTLVFRHMVGNGSIFAPEDIWRVRRKINALALAPKHINKFVRVFTRNSEVLVDKLAVHAGQGDVSLWNHYCSYILLSACETTLGNSVNLRPREFQPFCEAFVSYFDNVITRLFRPWLYSITVYKLLPEATQQSLNKKIVWSFINKLIYQKKELMKKEQSDSSSEEDNLRTHDDLKSLLELLISYSGGYSETELREESLVLLLASIDTTVSVSGFASVLLSQHLDVQDKVYEEIEEVFDEFDQTITIHDLNKLKYLEAVLKETMRLYPTTPLIMRKCQKDTKLPSGLVLNEGCQALINIWGLHRNPKYWGPDADKFRPERFLDATPEQLTAFIPFSSGPRNCAGNRIGMIALKTTLVSILRKYRLRPAASFVYNEQNPLRVKHTLVTKHLDNFQVQLEHRI